ncbi:MAG: class I SAM-dependent methyltransferase [Nocardioides sp.]
MELTTFRWLLTGAGQRLLDQATHAYVDAEGDPVRSSAAVRRLEADPDKAAAALTQVTLRARAVDKFGDDAVRLYFTPDALEQATRYRVAEHRAARLQIADAGSVIDLGCGIGGDLIAFARAGLTAAGVDLDEVRVAMAQANLEALELGGAAQVADATGLNVGPFGAAYVDPSRRTAAGRSFAVDDWTPSWEFVTGLLSGRAVAKVAPGIRHELIPDGVEAEWVSERGDVKEAALWSPALATARRRATVIASGGLASLTEEDDPFDGRDRPVREVGGFLYEPDGAVIRSGLVTAVAAGVAGGLIDEHIAYVTSDASYRTPFATGYQVVEQLPYREKQLKAALAQRAIGRLTIKKRGVDLVPEQLRKRLDLAGDNEATLVLTRVAGVGTALLVRPF